MYTYSPAKHPECWIGKTTSSQSPSMNLCTISVCLVGVTSLTQKFMNSCTIIVFGWCGYIKSKSMNLRSQMLTSHFLQERQMIGSNLNLCQLSHLILHNLYKDSCPLIDWVTFIILTTYSNINFITAGDR